MSNVLTSNSTLVCGKLRKFYPNCQQEWLNDLVLRNGDVIFNVSGAKEEPLYYYVNAAVLDYVIDYYKKHLHPRNIGSQFSCGINVTNGQLHMMCFRDGWSGTTAILKLPTLSAEEYPKRYMADSKPSPLGQDYESETIHAVEQQAKELGWNPSNVLWVKIDAGILLDTLTLPSEQQQTPASAPIFTRPDVVDFEPLGNKQIRESLFEDDFVEEKESPIYNISTATKEIRDKGFTCYFYIPANKIHHPAVAEKCWLFDAFIKGVRIAWKCRVQDIKEKAMYVPRRGMYYIELNIQFGRASTPNNGSIRFEQVTF